MPDTLHHQTPIRHHRSLFLSDLHLGAFGSRADLVLEFLRRNVAETYVLVGDILDVSPPVLSRWSPAQQAVLDHLDARMKAGAGLVYVRGNHDPFPEVAEARHSLPITSCDQAVHVGADGRRHLVLHGDAEDRRVFRWHVLTRLGSRADRLLRTVDAWIGHHVYQGATGRRSVIECLLSLANRGLYPGRAHERRLVELARAGGFDGVICGHFHMAELRDLRGLSYANCGDWMDSFTAIGEDSGGRMHLLGGRAAFTASPRPQFRPALEPA